MTATLTSAYAVRRPYDAPALAEANATLRERPESYESGELTTAGSGTTGNRPAGSGT